MSLVSTDGDIEALADAVLPAWGEMCSTGRGDLESGIAALYRARLAFPCSWPECRREALIARYANIDSGELSTAFDDLIDECIDTLRGMYGAWPHHDDSAALIDVSRRGAMQTRLTWRLQTDLLDRVAEEGFREAM